MKLQILLTAGVVVWTIIGTPVHADQLPSPRPVISEPRASLVVPSAVARLQDGAVALLMPAESGTQLLVSRTPRPITLKDFAEPIPLFGTGGVLSKSDRPDVGMEVAGSTIHIVCGSSLGLEWHAATLPVTKDSKWAKHVVKSAGPVQLQDVVSDGRGRAVAVYRESLDDGRTMRLAVATREAATGSTIAESRDGIFAARAALDGAGGVLRVVWNESELAPRVMQADIDPAGKSVSRAPRVVHGAAHPTVTVTGGRTFVASEQPDGTIRVEWRGGAGPEGVQTLRGRAGLRPTLAVDVHGVVWLFAVGLDQRGLFYRRFLGAGFGEESECGAAPGVWNLSLSYSVEDRVGESDDGFAILQGEYLAADSDAKYRYRFRNLPVPRYAARDDRHVMFLDMLEVAEVENVQQKVGAAVRSDANPLNLNGPAGSHDAAVAGYATVMRESGKFRLWYNADSDDPGRTWVICYAESEDGVRWTKPELGLFDYKGSKKNNLLFAADSETSTPLIIRDDRDADPARRYKMVLESGFEGGTSIYLSESFDGIRWTWPPHPLWGKSRAERFPKNKQTVRGFFPWHEPLSSFFYDPITHHPDFRWKIYGQDIYAAYPHHDPRPVRNLSLVYGATPFDFVGHDANPVLDPRTLPGEDQIHGGLVQPYQGMYVGLYQHWWGDDWNTDLRLAASRDGIHFVRVQPQTAVLPLGAPGTWDSGMLTTPNFVFAHDGKLWLYYRGSSGTLATGRAIQDAAATPDAKKLAEPWSMLTGLARLREDGFAYLTPGSMQRPPQPARTTVVPNYRVPLEGRVTTIPIDARDVASRTLHVNVEFFAPGLAWLKAQLRDADSGEVIPGFSFDGCDAVREASLDRTITWKGSADLQRVKAARVRVEFQLFGMLDQPKLYSFWFSSRHSNSNP